jgi:hypothetical protein
MFNEILLELKICTYSTYNSVHVSEIILHIMFSKTWVLTKAQERKLEVADMRMVVLDVWA